MRSTKLLIQAEALHKHIAQLPDRLDIDLVVSSPLTRTLETATGVFASQQWTDSSQGAPLMREQPAEQVCAFLQGKQLFFLRGLPMPVMSRHSYVTSLHKFAARSLP